MTLCASNSALFLTAKAGETTAVNIPLNFSQLIPSCHAPCTYAQYSGLPAQNEEHWEFLGRDELEKRTGVT